MLISLFKNGNRSIIYSTLFLILAIRIFGTWFTNQFHINLFLAFGVHLFEAVVLQMILKQLLMIRIQNNFPILFYLLFTSLPSLCLWNSEHLVVLIYILALYRLALLIPEIQSYQIKTFHASLLTGSIIIISPFSWYISLIIWLIYIVIKNLYQKKAIIIILLGQIIIFYLYFSAEILFLKAPFELIHFFTKDLPSTRPIWESSNYLIVFSLWIALLFPAFVDLIQFYPRKKKEPRALSALFVAIFLLSSIFLLFFDFQTFTLSLWILSAAAILSNYFEYVKDSKKTILYMTLILIMQVFIIFYLA